MRGQIPSVDLALRANNTIVHQPMPIIIGAHDLERLCLGLFWIPIQN